MAPRSATFALHFPPGKGPLPLTRRAYRPDTARTQSEVDPSMIVNIVKRNLYQDSVALMQVSAQLKMRPEIADASLMMGTPPNKEILQDAGLLAAEGESA